MKKIIYVLIMTLAGCSGDDSNKRLKIEDIAFESDIIKKCVSDVATSSEIVYADDFVELFCQTSYVDTTADLALFPNLQSVAFHSLNHFESFNMNDFSGVNEFTLTSSKASALDFTPLEKLTMLSLGDNKLLSEINLKNNIGLKKLLISESPIVSLDLSALIDLESIKVFTHFVYTDLDGEIQVNRGTLEDINFDSNINIYELWITGGKFANLTLKNHTKLSQVFISGSLDSVELDLLGLETLNLSNNNLEVIDLSLLPNLDSLNLSSNNLITIDLSYNLLLNSVNLEENNFNQEAINYLDAIDWIEELKF